MNKLKILLVCSSRFAIPSMRDLVFQQLLAAVVIPSFCTEMIEEVQQLLAPMGIPVILVDKENNEAELKKAIKKYDTAMVFMMTYRYKITKAVYELPAKGFYNFHSGPLPEYRGADPIFVQLIYQEKYAGVTVHKVDEGMDTGPVVIKELLKIEPGDTYGILNNKLGELAAKLSGILVKMAAFDIAIPSKPQDETKARYFSRQNARDIVIQWDIMDAGAIVALVNACNPWNKGAVTSLNNKIIRLLDVEKIRASTTQSALPGTVLTLDENSITIAAMNGESLRVDYIYIDEGFMKAGRLAYTGVTTGSRFTNL